jgi:MYXO-CTERM domain-containing protein
VAQKTGVCEGAAEGTGTVSTFRPGQTLTVRFTETVPHPGPYRILIDTNGGDDFPNPEDCDDIDTAGDDLGNGVTVLADNLLPAPGDGRYACTTAVHTPAERTPTYAELTYQVTLPNVQCDPCSLQVIQVMTDKYPWEADQNSAKDIYFRCADIKLSNVGDVTVDEDPAPVPDAGPGNNNNTNNNNDPAPDAGNGNPNNNDNNGGGGGGCAVAETGSGGVLILLLGALFLRRRRRN